MIQFNIDAWDKHGLLQGIGFKMVFNTVVQVASNIMTSLISLVVIIQIARNLKADNFGIYSFVLIFIGIFKPLMNLINEHIAVQGIAVEEKDKARLFFGNVLVLKFILSLVTILIVFSAINFVGYPAITSKLLHIGCLFFISLVLGSSIIVLQANLRMVYDAIAHVLSVIIYLIWVIVSFKMGKGLVAVIWGLVICDMLRWVIVFFASCRIIKPLFAVNIKLWHDIIKKSFPVWLASIFVAIYLSFDVLMLSKVIGNYAVGVYAAAYKLINVLMILPQAICISAFPWLVKLYAFDKERFRRFYFRLFDYMLIIAAPLLIVLTILSKNITLVLYKLEFLESAVVLKILAFALPFIFLSSLSGYTLLAVNQRLKCLVCAFSAALVNVVFNIIFITQYGIQGAAAVVVLTHAFLFFLMIYYLYKTEHLFLSFKVIPKIVLINLIFAAAVVTLKSIKLYYALPTFIVAYSALIYFSKCIDFSEFRLYMSKKRKEVRANR